LRDLPWQKIPREFCGEGDPAIFLCSHVPRRRFFDGTNQEISKKQEGKNVGKKKKRSQCYSKKQERKNVGKKKKRSRSYF
jgi:hypothetical protein